MSAAQTVSEFYVYLVTFRHYCDLYVVHDETRNKQ